MRWYTSPAMNYRDSNFSDSPNQVAQVNAPGSCSNARKLSQAAELEFGGIFYRQPYVVDTQKEVIVRDTGTTQRLAMNLGVITSDLLTSYLINQRQWKLEKAQHRSWEIRIEHMILDRYGAPDDHDTRLALRGRLLAFAEGIISQEQIVRELTSAKKKYPQM